MVEKIEKVSGSAASAATRIHTSVSLAEPEAAWVAERQSIINAELEQHSRDQKDQASQHSAEDGLETPARHSTSGSSDSSDISSDHRLSGESERIGTGNLEDDVPFGEHVGFL